MWLVWQKTSRETSVTVLQLKTLLLRKKRNGRQLGKDRVELALPSNLKEGESVKTRETSEQDQGMCRVGESPQENAKQALKLELDSKTRRPRICSHKLLPRTLLGSSRPRRGNPIRETTLGRVVEKTENGLCWRYAIFTKETGKCGKVHQIESQQIF